MKKIFMVMAVVLMSAMSFGQGWDKIGCACVNAYKNNGVASGGFVCSSNVTLPFGFSGKYTILDVYNDNGCEIIKFGNYNETENYIRLSDLNKTNCRYNLASKYIEFFPKTVEYTIPKAIYENYMIGDRCFKSGWAFLSTGALCAILGASLVKDDATASKALFAIGGTFIGVSIPLVCFGDHIKRECNMNYELFNLKNNKK